MIYITCRFLIQIGIRGLTIFPFIIVSQKCDLKDKVLVNHEKIHIRQQLELLILPFYIWYLVDFIFQYYKYKNKHEAYRNIIFEREAYQNEKQLDYLENRKLWSFLKRTSIISS
jgi:hypothetical protein